MASIIAAAILAVTLPLITAVGCTPPDPNANTPTSGRLIVYVDNIYAPILKTLADTFMVRSPNAKIEIRTGSAREMVQKMLYAQTPDTIGADSGAVVALVMGRKFLADEQQAIQGAGLAERQKEYTIGYDGIALVVPDSSPRSYVTIERLRKALASPTSAAIVLDSTLPAAEVRFLLTDQNSSTLPIVQKRLLDGKDIVAPVRYYSTVDSVLAMVAAGNGIGITSWYRAHLDSARLKTLALGWIDSLGNPRAPAIVHPTTLVTDAYPLKQPLMGYTFGSDRSLAIGFFAWLTRSEDAQHYIAFIAGLQPAIRMRIVLPAE